MLEEVTSQGHWGQCTGSASQQRSLCRAVVAGMHSSEIEKSEDSWPNTCRTPLWGTSGSDPLPPRGGEYGSWSELREAWGRSTCDGAGYGWSAASSDPAGPLLPSGGPTGMFPYSGYLRFPAPKLMSWQSLKILTRVARLALPPPRLRALKKYLGEKGDDETCHGNISIQ